MNIGKLIKNRRLALGLSQEELGRKLGISRAAVGSWEDNKTGPSRKRVPELARILQIEPGTFDPLIAEGVKIADVSAGSVRIPLVKLNQLEPDDIFNSAEKSGDFIHAQNADPNRSVAAQIVDDSMSPTYNVGDIVILDTSLLPLNDDDVIVAPDDGPCLLRKFHPRGTDRNGSPVFDLVSTDPNYITLTSNSDNRIKVLGVVIEHRRRLRK